MKLTPEKIYENHINSHLDKSTAFEQLASLIENSDDVDIRLESIKLIGDLDLISNQSFKLLETILVNSVFKLFL